MSASSVGRVFALVSAALAGGAAAMLLQHGKHSDEGRRHCPDSAMRRSNGDTQSSPAAGPRPHGFDDSNVVSEGGHSGDTFLERLTSKGLPSHDRVCYFMGFVASLNYERRIPNWVLEHLPGIGPEGGDVSEATRDGMKFFADKTVPVFFRVLPNDYIGLDGKGEACTRGLSRGHLAAAQFHKRTTEELAETFNMNANTVSQDMTMNAVDWMRLESLTKKLRRHYENGLWIVTGPVFHPRFVDGDARAWRWAEWPQRPAALKPAEYATLNGDEVRHQGSAGELRKRHKVVCYEVVGRHNVAVPTHLFKVVLGERADGSHEVAAFLMPNEPITVEKPLVTYQVPVAHVEWLTGLEFFRQALNNDVSRQRTLQGIDNLPNICKRLTCEARVGGMFQVYRDVARLRAAGSLSELQKVYNAFLTEQQNRCDGTANKVVTLNEVVAHEYRERMKELVGRREDGIG